MARKFDIKKVLVEKGEVVGVIAAGAITLLLCISALIMTVKADSPSALAKKLTAEAKLVEGKLNTPPPTPNAEWLPSKNPSQATDYTVQTIELPSRYHGQGQVFASAYPMDDKARQPRIYPLAANATLSGEEKYREGRCTFEYAQVRSYLFNPNGDQIAVLEDKKGSGSSSGKMSLPGYGSARGPGGMVGGRGGRGLPPGSHPEAAASRAEANWAWKNLDDLENALNGGKLAEVVRPVRMGVIVATFPYRDQLKEFCTALNLSPDAMIAQLMQEPVLDADGKPTFDKDGKPKENTLPAFRFKGALVQRRQVDVDGKPLLTKGADGKPLIDGWEDIPLEDAYLAYYYDSGKRTAPDPLDLDPVLMEGLAMPRLLQMRDKNYKTAEQDLDNIKMALKPFADSKGKAQRLRPQQFIKDSDLNPYTLHRSQDDQRGPGGMDRPSRPSDVPPMPRSSGPKFGPGGGPFGPRNQPGETSTKVLDPVQYALIRLIDVTNLEPGKTYQYRIKIRMANPNYRKPLSQVADPKYAVNPELISEDWYVIPGYLAVPAELTLYAVDQAVVEKGWSRKYEGINPPNRTPMDPRISTVVQIHRWVEKLPAERGQLYPVGEWSVAERVLVNRGEAIDRDVKVLVPYWNMKAESFVLVGNAPDSDAKPKGTAVEFGSKLRPSLLLDFDNGDSSWSRIKDQPVREKARSEILVLTPDGRVQAHDSATDTGPLSASDTTSTPVSEKRIDRLKEWRDRIEEVRNGTRPNPMGDGPRPPFGGGGTPPKP